jgi:hypothetical protein
MKTTILSILLTTNLFAQSIPDSIQQQIVLGNFSVAQTMMRTLIANNRMHSFQDYDLEFEIDRLDRIRRDFSLSEARMMKLLKRYYPEITDERIASWEKSHALEMQVIDGEKKYFRNAVWNLFRIDKEAKALKQKVDGPESDTLAEILKTHLPLVLKACDSLKTSIVQQVPMTLRYTLTVYPNAVPDGEIIRCWLPYPKEIHKRQQHVKFLSTNCPNPIIAGDNVLQRTLYLEKPAMKDSATIFSMELQVTSAAEYYDLSKIKSGLRDTDANEVYVQYVREESPHIVFSDRIKEVSEKVVGKEQQPLKKAKLIFDWISDTFPWASALEYSTVPNIAEYVLTNGHGDCGMVTLLFMTLCRYNGIPTRWQSGWMLHPGDVNLHDWCEMYVDRIGWVPVDQSFGLQPSTDKRIRDFFFGGIDSYRLIVNDGYSKPLFPAKIYPRSETIDFQRGEVEWKGGNLYFDQWTYDMAVSYGE